eukprot:Colp12_sorted_trinity150504_noHs@24186
MALFLSRGFATKITTGLVGYPVIPEARQVLSSLYSETLSKLQQLPEDANYRRHTESITKYRKAIVESNKEDDEVERVIASGQLEELVKQAKDELQVLELMKEHKAWEPLVGPAPAGQWKWP